MSRAFSLPFVFVIAIVVVVAHILNDLHFAFARVAWFL